MSGWKCLILHVGESPTVVYGCVVLSTDGVLSIDLKHPQRGDGGRPGMAARALADRLREANPKTEEDLKKFAGKQANEIRLSAPYELVSIQGR